jgi:glycerol-3-phosphate dehydrogenase (NAD(P)+)
MVEATKIPVYRVAVLGGGSFGTALANIIAHNGHITHLWMRTAEQVARCQSEGENSKYLPGYALDANLILTSDLAASLSDADIVIIAIPSHSFRSVAATIAPLVPASALVISTTKGLEGDGFTLMSEVLRQELPGHHIGVLSGPNFAKEIIQNQYTASVIASPVSDVRDILPKVLSSQTFRVYSNPDMFGVELGGALKNIYAVITGMAAAQGCGQNTLALILTRSLAEMSRFANKLGANPKTFLGLAGMGDLILTCTSDLSRNYRVGFALGKGLSLDEALETIGGQVAEGINTLKIVNEKARELNVYMPLVKGLHAILFEGQDIRLIVRGLMTGAAASDVEG